ncbi:MAG: amino acid-binding protein [Proteobacteria bacterium]|nr:MAG: amino acid-binding protein [Pseudomonadota bacterium]PIE67350.1 MAG: amino acid-binding protein [Deltaproteobacteria bacterium]
MVRTEISLFLKNEPGELGRLATLMGEAGINIDALTIQDASAYVLELFRARGKALKRIASAASYNSMRKDSAQFALIRLLAEDGKTNAAIDLLSQNKYVFDILPVIAVKLNNDPGELARLSSRFGEEGVNINYVYGSVAGPDAKCLFVFCPENIDLAASFFSEEHYGQ